jgi:hypothetical protein
MRLSTLVVLAGLCISGAHAVDVVTTIAGSGSKTDYSDGPALNRTLFFPKAVYVHTNGDIYFCDETHRVRKVSGGNITTIAGTGNAGFSGDGGPATSADLRNPKGVFFDGTSVYISDTENHRVRKVTAGTITTIAGDGVGRFNGDGVATAKSVNEPTGLFVLSGVVYVADTENHVVRTISSGTLSTIAGTGGAAGNVGDGSSATLANLDSPTSVIYDGSINIYILDSGNNRIRVIDMGGTINNLAGDISGNSGFADGNTNSARFNNPQAMVFNGSGLLYVIDTENHALRSITTAGFVTTIAGGTPPNPQSGFGGDGALAVNSKLSSPIGLGINASTMDLVIADTQNQRLRLINGTPPININTVAGTGAGDNSSTGSGALQNALALPHGVFSDPAGNVYIADTFNHTVVRVDTAGNFVKIAGTGVPGFSGDGGAATSAQLQYPEGVYVDGTGNVYISDAQNNRIRRVRAADGIIETVCGTGVHGDGGDNGPATAAHIAGPGSLTGDLSGAIIFADQDNDRVRKFQPGGNIVAFAGSGEPGFFGDGGPATAALLDECDGVFFEPVSGNVFIADRGNHRIRKVAPDGTISTAAGNGLSGSGGEGGPATAAPLSDLGGVVAAPDGTIIFSEVGSNKIRSVDPAGTLQLAAGTGVRGYSGDGPTLAANATFNAPFSLAASPRGIVIGDLANNRVRLLRRNNLPTATIAATIGTDAVSSALAGTTVTFTALAVDLDNDTPLTYAWNFGDGTSATGNPVTKAFGAEGTFAVSVTVSDPNEAGVPATFNFASFAPNSGADGVTGVSTGTKTTSPLDGLSIMVTNSNGGVYSFFIDVNSLTREAFDVNTGFDSINGRVATRNGVRPQNKFSTPEIFVTESVATDTATGAKAGKARKTIVVSKKETGGATTLVDNRSSTELTMKSVKGKFIFKDNNAADAKSDTVTFSGTIKLPGGLDLTATHELWISIGNIVDMVSVGAKGKVTLPSTLGRLKKVSIKYPKLADKATVTAGDETAAITFTVNTADMDVKGFDTEGVSASVQNASKTAVDRDIQVGMLLAGVAYQSTTTVQFKTSPKVDKTTLLPESGQINGRSSTR